MMASIGIPRAGRLALFGLLSLLLVTADCRSPRPSSSSGKSEVARRQPITYPDSMLKPLGRNQQGYEEFLWVKDSSVMVKLPSGTFTMGSSDSSPVSETDQRPQREVFVNEYYIDKYEITNRQYMLFLKSTGRSLFTDTAFQLSNDYLLLYHNLPVANVTNDFGDYLTWAGKRLPTEAEWEKAARGTDARKYPWGNAEPDSGGKHRASHSGYSDDGTETWVRTRPTAEVWAETSPVGSFPLGASPYGCLDMAGNVWEWCSTDLGYLRGQRHDPGVELRGGSYESFPSELRCAHRERGDARVCRGLRCVVPCTESK